MDTLSNINDKEEREMDPMVITLILLAFAIVMFVLEKIPLALTL